MKEKSELSEEFLAQLTPLERNFLVSWDKLQKSEEFQTALKALNEAQETPMPQEFVKMWGNKSIEKWDELTPYQKDMSSKGAPVMLWDWDEVFNEMDNKDLENTVRKK